MNKVWTISRKHLKEKPIINRSLYRYDISLFDLIQELCVSWNKITTDDIINLCVKFLFAHRDPASTNTLVGIKDIERLYALWMRYTELQRKGITEINLEDNSATWDLQYFIDNWYGTNMLGDIAPSVEIFRSIVWETLKKSEFDGKYFWLDLWTGTWWLMLAQYIQAKRNGFNDIDIIGIEQDDKMVRSTVNLFSTLPWDTLEAWKPLQGDTVKDASVYDCALRFTDKRILTYVANENIPTCSIKMDGTNDPFFQNVFMLDVNMSDRISSVTKWFPRKMRVHILAWEWKTLSIDWDFQSRYWFESLISMEQILFPKREVDVMNLWVLEFVSPYWISIEGDEIQKLTCIWKSVESLPGRWGKVYPNKKWRRRWDW